MERLDPTRLRMLPLARRRSKLEIEQIAIPGDSPNPDLPDAAREQVRWCAGRIRRARDRGASVILTYGAHLVKNGLAPVVIDLIEKGWVTHVATNGAGSIHDWEFAYLGRSTEDVRVNTAEGRFGTWDETGRFIHLAVAVGGLSGLGYGESVGKLISDEHLHIPSADALREQIADRVCPPEPDEDDTGATRSQGAASAADLLLMVERFNLEPGRQAVPHPWKRYSIQAAAFRTETPFTVHPGIGYDIIYTHPMANGGAIGRGAMRDFLAYAHAVGSLSGGVHIAVGSSVMAPMIFEKALSMANNLALAEGRPTVDGHALAVVDIQEGGDWDWSTGEPPMDHPAYYLRFCKTFYRMGGELQYICLDNVAFMSALRHELS